MLGFFFYDKKSNPTRSVARVNHLVVTNRNIYILTLCFDI